MSMKVETQEVREGLFRFGQWFGKQNIQFSFYRDPVASFLCRGVVNDAMRKGFDCVMPGTEDPTPWNDDFQAVKDNHWSEALQTIFFQRRNGKALHVFNVKDGNLINIAGATGQYRLYYDNRGQPTKGIFNVRIASYAGQPKIELEENNDEWFELITDRAEAVGEGLSSLMAPWDIMFAIYMLTSHSAYFVARVGAGIKDLAVDEAALTDTEGTGILTTLAKSMTEFGSAADTIIRPKTLAGQPVDFDIKTVDTAVDFNMILGVYLTLLSILTGIPKSTLEGIVPGQLTGAEVNEESYFDFLRDLQDSYVIYLKWFVNQLNKHYKWFTDKDEDGNEISTEFDLLYKVRRVMSAEAEVALLASRLANVNSFKTAGVTTIKAFEQSGIEGIEESDLKEGVDEMIDFSTNDENVDENVDDEEGDQDDE